MKSQDEAAQEVVAILGVVQIGEIRGKAPEHLVKARSQSQLQIFL